MIDLGFLTDAEQEAILKVLQRDAQLKKAEDERVRNLQKVVRDENELKYKSGQWFYDAKSRRHNDKIHGAELVRASIRKRKKPATIAELSEMSKDKSKRRSLHTVNKDLFIPPELYGVMEIPDEADEDVKQNKAETNHSAKKVSFLSPENNTAVLNNGNASPAKQRKNPFNSGDLVDETDHRPDAPNQTVNAGQVNGIEETKTDKEALYSTVTPISASSDQEFNMDDALTEPRFLGQGRRKNNIRQNETPLVFGQSYGGGGKISYEYHYPTRKPDESYIFPREQVLVPERTDNIESSYYDLEKQPTTMTQHDQNHVESRAPWRRNVTLENTDSWRQPSADITEQETSTRMVENVPEKVDFKVEDPVHNIYLKNGTNSKDSIGEYKGPAKYESIFLRNRHSDQDQPVGLTNSFPIVQNMPEPYRPVQTNEMFLHDKQGKLDLPRSANFKVMSMKDRINEMPRQQMPDPSQFQNLKHFWNAEEKSQPRGDVDTLPNKIITDVLNRSKTTKSDLRQRNSKEIPADDIILPNSLSEEEQTSHKVASWLAQTPTVYGAEPQDHSDQQIYPDEEVIENIQKLSVDRKSNAEDFVKGLQKLETEASQITDTKKLWPEQCAEAPSNNKTTPVYVASMNPTEQMAPLAAGGKTMDINFYTRVRERSENPENTKSWNTPPKPTVYFEHNGGEPIQEHVEKTVAPAKESSALNIGFEKLREEYQIEGSYLPSEELSEEEATELEENIEKSTTPKSQDQQEFLSSLKRLEIEASTPHPYPSENQELLSEEEEMTPITIVTPAQSSYKIGFENFDSTKDQGQVPIEQSSVYQPKQYYTSNDEDSAKIEHEIEETIEETKVSNANAERELRYALEKLELEACETPHIYENISDEGQEISFDKPHMTPILQTNMSTVQSIDTYTPTSLSQTEPDLYSSKAGRSVVESEEPPKEESFVFKPIIHIEQPKYNFNDPVKEEQPIKSTIVETQENSDDFQNRLMRLQEEAAMVPEEPKDLLVGDTVGVLRYPDRKIISKKVFPNVESITTSDDPNDGQKTIEVVSNESSSWNKPKDANEQISPVYARIEALAKHPRSANQSGSYKRSSSIALYKKPEHSPGVTNSEQGMEESNPILSALRRSTAKTLNSKAVEEVTPTSTNKVDSDSPKEDALGPATNSFPENAEKFKRLSQSVPTFLQDETDGRETDSASESSFKIGRHKKSPSSLTNLSGSSGMASMSSVSGSVMSMYSGDFGNVDVKGSIEFALEYVENLKEFLIYIYQCKELSAADVKKQRSDPYVKTYLLPEKSKMGKRKTAVKKKTLNPVYNEVLRYKIPYETLVAQTLNLSVWHHDTLGRNSFLGEVNVNMEKWDRTNKERSWYQLEPRTPAAGIGLENRGEIKLSLKYIPMSTHEPGPNTSITGEVHIWIIECVQLPMLRENKINSFVKCTILPDTSRKSRQKTRTVDKTPNPVFNHTMVYDGFKAEDLREACVELTVWDHTRLSNHFIGGLRLGLGTGKSYGTAVDWMDSSHEESTLWERMITSPNTWAQGVLPLRMFKMAKLAK